MASAESISHHFPIGKAPIDAYQRSFLIDARGKVEVTSVDISNHGMFLVVGCSNGAVLLYNLTKRVQTGEGIYLGQINCKGLHSVMSMKVKISDDCRFCFAGVIRGSNELLAIDLSHLQWEWNEFNSLPMPTSKGKKQSAIVTGKSSVDLFETFVLADAKLKGFGACCSKFTDTTVSEYGVLGHQYLLASGLGIKNVHVWELTVYDEPVTLEGGILPAKRDHWKCIYDVATNGNTITHLGFRNFGKELISKSGTFNIRVWDISKYKDEPNSKPPYEDIGNSQDVKCLLETSDFSYGGIYDFSMVKVDKNIPKEANRNSFELPDKVLPESLYEESVRRRRTMREVVDVVGTQDGEHVLIKVADGGVLHFHHPKTTHTRSTTPIGDINNDNAETNAEKSSEGAAGGIVGRLQELPSPAKDGELEQAWTVKRVGSEGLVIVARAFFRPDAKERERESSAAANTPGIINTLGNAITPQQKGMTLVSVFPLSQLNRDLTATSMVASDHSMKRWHPTGNFYRSPKPIDRAEPSSEITASAVESTSSISVSSSENPSSPSLEHGSAVSTQTAEVPKAKTSILVPAILYPMDAEALQTAAVVSTPVGNKCAHHSPAGVASAGVFSSGSDIQPAIKKRKTPSASANAADNTFQSPPATLKPPLPPSGLSRQSSTSSSTKNQSRTNLHAMFEDAAIAAGMPSEETTEELDKDDKRVAGRPRGSSIRHRQSHLLLQQLQQRQFSVDDEVEEDDAEVQSGPYQAIAIPPYVAAKPPQFSSAIIPILPPSGYTSLLEQQQVFRKMEICIQNWCESFQSHRYSAENVLLLGFNDASGSEVTVGEKRSLDATVLTETKRMRLSIKLPSASSQSSSSNTETITPAPDVVSSTGKQQFLTSLLVKSLGVYANHQFGRILFEQERLKSQLIQEVKQLFLVTYRNQLLLGHSAMSNKNTLPSLEIEQILNKEMDGIVRRYHAIICEELLRQKQDFLSARQRDMISHIDPVSSAQTLGIPLTPKSSSLVGSMSQGAQVQVHFRYMDILQRAMNLPEEVCHSLV